MAVAVRRARSDSDFRRLHRLFVAYEAGLPPRLRHGSVPHITRFTETFSAPNAAFIATHEGVAIGCAAVKGAGDDRLATRRPCCFGFTYAPTAADSVPLDPS